MMKKILLALMFILSAACSQAEQASHAEIESLPQQEDGLSKVEVKPAFASPTKLFVEKAKDEMVEGSGKVVRLLPDDNHGSRHQKFLVEIEGGQTLLIAHNIDLALRINRLQVGDKVQFRGEYSYNPKGGVVHWTHLDPRNMHEAGWIKHHGIMYQ
jgi:hypothetical protein